MPNVCRCLAAHAWQSSHVMTSRGLLRTGRWRAEAARRAAKKIIHVVCHSRPEHWLPSQYPPATTVARGVGRKF
ncbi:hypothetical protein RRG08_060806 [Elysia crispata]|uniref:Uncharacterized protein n=1 Tax=Elysia crispata TaxID=231223 RepID=A0AAE0YVP1_9GAST|nr:hypothetical protein RRG08_060806 [Elysia crispata]